MKYLFDSRYKVINTTMVYLSKLVRICKAGQSEMLQTAVQRLMETQENLEALKSPPFGQEEIRLVANLQDRIKELVHLPENILPLVENTLREAKTLLNKIDPFTTHFEETDSIRKAELIGYILEVQNFLKSTLPNVNKTSGQILDSKSVIHKVIRDIIHVPYHDFEEKDKAAVVGFLQSFEAFRKAPSDTTANAFLIKTNEAIAFLQETKQVTKAVGKPLDLLYAAIRAAEAEMTLDPKTFPAFKDLLKTPAVLQAVSDLDFLTLPSDEMKEIKDTIQIAHKHMLLEEGATLVSRTRFIELFRVFGHEIIALKSHLNKNSSN